MEEYINLVLEQIRCSKAHPSIQKELKDHIEDQIETNLSDGMSSEEATKAAIKDMGNPIEVGISLDHIHRPQISWSMLGCMTIITLLAIFFHQDSYYTIRYLISFGLMLYVFQLDYVFFAKHVKIIAFILNFILFLAIYTNAGITLSDHVFYLYLFGIKIHLFTTLLLYIPVYSALIFHYYHKGYLGILYSIFWMLLPILLILQLPSLPLAFILFVSMLIQLTRAILLGWFQVSKTKTIIVLYSLFLGLPILLLLLYTPYMASYQVARFKAFFPIGSYHSYSDSIGYQANIMHQLFINSKFIGSSTPLNDLLSILPNWNKDYVLIYVSSQFGKFFLILTILLLFTFIILGFNICQKQKSQLGYMIGNGCVTVLFIQTSLNLLEIFGVIPISQTFLPFFSSGFYTIIIPYLLVGIILSVHRYKNIYEHTVSFHIDSSNE